MHRLLRTALALALLVPAIEAQVVTTIVNNGPSSELYDMVILGDGYQAHEQGRFDQDALDMVTYFQTEANKFPYGDYFNLYNVHTVFRASNESGADNPNRNIYRDTVYDATYWYGGTERCLYIQNTARAAADAALAPDTDGRVIVLVNDSKYGGCAGGYSVSYNGGSMEDVQAHEWGHSFGGLADEYDYGQSGTYSGSEPSSPNVTADPTGQAKWPLWLGFAGPTSTVGAYEGAGYYLYGLYRPETDCEMRSLNRPFCTVCREQIILQFHRRTSVIGSPLPAESTLYITPGTTVNFSFVNRIAHRPFTIEWLLDDVPQLSGATSYAWDTTGESGTHAVKVRLRDSSSEVRKDPGNMLKHEHSWSVDLSGCGPRLQFYGTGCRGAVSTPQIQTLGNPSIPGNVVMILSGGPSSRPVVLMMGFSDVVIGGAVPLPFDLGGLGMPSCMLLQSWDLSLPLFTSTNGYTQLPMAIPDDSSMSGGRLYFQWLCIDPGVNAFGATVSNAVQVTFCQ